MTKPFRNVRDLTLREINRIGRPKDCESCKSGDCEDCIPIIEHFEKNGVRIITRRDRLDQIDDNTD